MQTDDGQGENNHVVQSISIFILKFKKYSLQARKSTTFQVKSPVLLEYYEYMNNKKFSSSVFTTNSSEQCQVSTTWHRGKPLSWRMLMPVNRIIIGSDNGLSHLRRKRIQNAIDKVYIISSTWGRVKTLRPEQYFADEFFLCFSLNELWFILTQILIMLVLQNPDDNTSSLSTVIPWHLYAPSHYLNQWWPFSLK